MDERTEQNAARRTGGAEGFGSYIRRKRQEAGLTQGRWRSCCLSASRR